MLNVKYQLVIFILISMSLKHFNYFDANSSLQELGHPSVSGSPVYLSGSSDTEEEAGWLVVDKSA